jgi:hypothetical protein
LVAGWFAGPRVRSASQHGWQSGVLVAVKGEAPGSCASAHGPDSYLLTAEQWIVCVGGGSPRCYRQRAHAMNFRPQPVRRTRFDSNCRAALAVLRKAGFFP